MAALSQESCWDLYDGLMPLYLNHKGVSNASIGFWMAVLVSAGILGQWPIGRLADKFGRLLVLRVQVFVVILGSIAMLSQAANGPSVIHPRCRWLYAISGGDGLGL